MTLSLLDTAGQEEYDMLRTIVYVNADVVIVCYSVDDPNSYDNICLKWIPEVRKFAGKVPVVLVGNKTDLRHMSTDTAQDSPAGQMMSTDSGSRLAAKIHASSFVECSSRTCQGLDAVFEATAKAALRAGDITARHLTHTSNYSSPEGRRSSSLSGTSSNKQRCIIS